MRTERLTQCLYYVNTIKSELSPAKTYKFVSTDEKSLANKHCNDIVTKSK